MRPPDENQHGSTRPNLLSGARRRFGGDDNILERLERDSARHASGNRSRAAWYGAAASLILLVIIIVGWMAYERASTVEVIPMKRVPVESGPAVVTNDEPAAAPVQPLPVRPEAPVAPPVAARTPSATLHTQPTAPAPARNNAVASLPPLVLLADKNVAERKPAAPVNAGARVPAAPSPRPASPVRAAAVAQQQATPVRAVARPNPTVSHPRKPTSGTLSSEPVVDRDVALLSAIIIHDSAHAEEKAQLEAAATCVRASVKKCQGDTPPKPAAKNGAR